MELVKKTVDESEREQFGRAVTEHSRSMYRAARTLLDSDADAEDAVSEAVLRAWQSYGTLRKREAERAWFIKIAVNCAYEQRRKGKRIVYTDHLEELVPQVTPEPPDSLWEAVQRLPEEQRLAVMLFYYEDLPIAAIAKTMGVAQGTVKSRLSRGRQRLRTLLGEEGGQ